MYGIPDNLAVYSNNGSFQQGLERAGVAGALAAPPGDFVSIVVNNASGSKVDYYAQRTVHVISSTTRYWPYGVGIQPPSDRWKDEPDHPHRVAKLDSAYPCLRNERARLDILRR